MAGQEPVRRLRAGTVGRPHGLDGSFHVAGVVESVFAQLAVGSEVLVGDAAWRIERLAGHASRPILRLTDCTRREDAEALRGSELGLARAGAGELEEDEWWAQDLEGCAVRDGAREVGTVTALLELPSCEVLQVARAEAGDLLVPLVRDAVRDVDIDARVIDVDLAFLGEA